MRKILKGEDRRFKLGEFCLGLQFDFRHETIISNDKTKNPPKKKWSSMVPPPEIPDFHVELFSSREKKSMESMGFLPPSTRPEFSEALVLVLCYHHCKV